jgi:hypothetical protein
VRHVAARAANPSSLPSLYQQISLAAGGENEDYDMIAYIAKDDYDFRQCFVFDCGFISDDVLATFGQSFNLAQVCRVV